jgi:hypothetical protein
VHLGGAGTFFELEVLDDNVTLAAKSVDFIVLSARNKLFASA